MTYGFDDCTFTAIGTSTTETRLNSDSPLRVPSSAKTILEVIPYQMQLGAFTVDQSLMTAFRIQSDDVSVEPKRFLLYGVGTGDAAFASVQCPVLKAYPMNIPLSGFERINYRAQAQVANTVAPGVGATIVYSDTPGNGIEQFYQKPDDESVSGTTINTRQGGNTITVTGGGTISSLYALVTGGVATASEHDVGFMEFESSDFQTSMPYRVAVQPTATGLGGAAAANTGGAGIMEYGMPGGQGIPLNDNVTVNTFYTNRDGRTGASNFCGCVRYQR
jgi:hypothetical protein